MAQLITVSAGGVRGSGTKPAAKVRVAGEVLAIKPGQIRKGIGIPCDVYRSGPTTVRITNTTDRRIKVGNQTVEPGKSVVPISQAWTEVT